ncbi:MAG: hypothetical protein U9R39_02840 [Campylobacterota bacterium]|nr:hypothetical protein [Campylobacterota bacterium]
MKTNIIIFVVVFAITMLVIQTSDVPSQTGVPESGKAKRIPCQVSATTFERGFGDADIKIAQALLESGNVNITSSVEKAVYAESKMFNYIKLEDTDKIVQNELNKYIKTKTEQKGKLNLSYYIYENDVKDPGKKTKKSKLYAGYVVFQIKNENNKTIYKVQIDFMDRQGADIAQSIQCCVKSFATFNKK